GGTLSLDGVDLASPTTALKLLGGATATYSNATISNPKTAFEMAPGSSLTISHAAITGVQAASSMAGTFTASYLTYQKLGGIEGLVWVDGAAVASISDSTFSGTETGVGDYIVSSASHHLSVSYSIINGAHCSFHFGAVDQYTIDHVTT